MPEILCAFGVHCDAVAGWLGSYGGEDSPCDISRGVFAGEIGMPRLLKLFDRYGITTTWFIPGHTAESFPDRRNWSSRRATRSVCTATRTKTHSRCHRHRSGRYSNEASSLSFCGRRPAGYVAPWWEFSGVTNELLLEFGVKYDNSLMHADHKPYYVRVRQLDADRLHTAGGDVDEAVHAWARDGTDRDPGSWYLDDLPPMMFIKKSPNSHGFVNPRQLEELWRDQFDYIYREEEYAVFPLTIHPDVSGRPQVLLMLERLIEYINGHDGARWVTFEEVADDFAARTPVPSRA